MNIISITQLTESNCVALADILNIDIELRAVLRISELNIEPINVYTKFYNWCVETKSESYVIFLDTNEIGTISISRINKEKGVASIGLWIASKYWDNGFGKQAVDLAMNLARDKGIHTIKTKIEKENIRSRKLFEKYDFQVDEIEKHYIYYFAI